MRRDFHTSNDLREQFLLCDDVIFLNHGSFGACPRPVFEDYQRWQLELERQPVEFLGRRFTSLLHGARRSLATFVGADSDEVVFVPNVTVGVNTAARALPLSPGDQVLSTDQEYGAMDRTWRFSCQRRGASYVRRTGGCPLLPPNRSWTRSGVVSRTALGSCF